MDCITFTAERRGSRAAHAARSAVEQSHPGPLRAGRAEDRPRHGQGRGRLPALRAVRRALPDRGLGHAEILARYDPRREFMPTVTPISRVNDFVVRFANVNGSGSASANEMFARAVMRMGIPVAPRNIFPSNIQGLPTWYEVRVSEAGHLGARGGTDLMVAMNPQTFDKDIASIEPGGYVFYDSDQAAAAVEIPPRHRRHRRAAHRHLQPRIHRSAPAPAVQEHHLYRRAHRAARHGRRASSRSSSASSTRARTS